MLVKVPCISFKGILPIEVLVEVYVSKRGLPSFDIVGLAAKSVDESRHRVKTAFLSSGYDFRDKKITVNLAPADIHKDGSYYDLPIAVGIFCAQYNIAPPVDALFYGELSLDGTVRSTQRTLLLSIYAKENKFRKIYIPKFNFQEASVINTVEVIGVSTLAEIFEHILHGKPIIQSTGAPAKPVNDVSEVDSRESKVNTSVHIIGQLQAKRALEIAAAGAHNLLLTGPPGTGKTLLANSLPLILPELNADESVEVTKIYSYTGEINPKCPLVTSRPFRSPHHTASFVGIVGGGNPILPGEITRAHRGVLFLDEMPEFARNILEALRQPMQEGNISITRSRGSVTFPAKFMLIGACNPCPCGYYGHPSRDCICPVSRINAYKRKLSGPVLDRIDLFAKTVPLLSQEVTSLVAETDNPTWNIQEVSSRVFVAREIQLHRLVNYGIATNSEMTASQIKKVCNLSDTCTRLLSTAASKLMLSPRACMKIIKIGRTIADLENSKHISEHNLAEALQYRQLT